MCVINNAVQRTANFWDDRKKMTTISNAVEFYVVDDDRGDAFFFFFINGIYTLGGALFFVHG